MVMVLPNGTVLPDDIVQRMTPRFLRTSSSAFNGLGSEVFLHGLNVLKDGLGRTLATQPPSALPQLKRILGQQWPRSVLDGATIIRHIETAGDRPCEHQDVQQHEIAMNSLGRRRLHILIAGAGDEGNAICELLLLDWRGLLGSSEGTYPQDRKHAGLTGFELTPKPPKHGIATNPARVNLTPLVVSCEDGDVGLLHIRVQGFIQILGRQTLPVRRVTKASASRHACLSRASWLWLSLWLGILAKILGSMSDLESTQFAKARIERQPTSARPR